MKRETDDIYGGVAQASTCDLPLFDLGPFSNSRIDPAGVEKVIAGLIWNRKRISPIRIAEIAQCTGLSDRTIKDVVEQLRATHRCAIGASRQEPAGYFWIHTAEDRETAVRPYREQILTMWGTLRVLDSPAALRELHGQLRLREEGAE